MAEQQRQKKSTSKPKTKGRSKSITVIIVSQLPGSIPKGAARERLRKIGRVKDIPFQRYLNEDEVEELITESFSSLGNIAVQYLQAHRNNTLTVAKQQQLNGIEVIELAKSGSLYLMSSFKDSKDKTAALLQKATEIVDKLNVSLHVLLRHYV